MLAPSFEVEDQGAAKKEQIKQKETKVTKVLFEMGGNFWPKESFVVFAIFFLHIFTTNNHSTPGQRLRIIFVTKCLPSRQHQR
jgi:hypothetical protein